jgi:hypothetical protein
VIHRLNESGLTPQAIDEVLLMVDSIMAGRVPLAHVLEAAKEVCRECELSSTHQHVADALACLAGEVMHYEDPSLDGQAGGPGRMQSGDAYWNDKRRGRAGQAQA